MTIRKSRFEYFASLFSKKNLEKPTREKKPSVGAVNRRWAYQLPNGQSGYVYAKTKSEARAEIKRHCDLKDRVPVGTEIKAT